MCLANELFNRGWAKQGGEWLGGCGVRLHANWTYSVLSKVVKWSFKASVTGTVIKARSG